MCIRDRRSAVGHIQKHADLVHPLHALLPESRQAAVVLFFDAGAQGAGLGVGHAQLADALGLSLIHI